MQPRHRPFVSATLTLATIAWGGVLLQFYLSIVLALANGRDVAYGTVQFFGYFTILTNILVATALTLPPAAGDSRLGRFFLRGPVAGAIATSIGFVSIAYHLLLRNVWSPQGLQWLADVVLHYVTPGLYVLYWWLVPSKLLLRWVHPLLWSLYPALYLAYALVRGSILGRYPYPFIDAAEIGYEQVLWNCIGLLVTYVALGMLFVALGKVNAKNAWS